MSDRIMHLEFKLNKDIIANVMNENNISIEALSYFCRINSSRLLRILEGTTSIQLSELLILSETLKISINNLMLMQ